MTQPIDLLVNPIGELATAQAGDKGPIHGRAMNEVQRIRGGALAIRDGKVVAAGKAADVLAAVQTGPKTVLVNADGKVVTPGLVDPHTHTIFGGNRSNEFLMRCQGKSYAEIAKAGGGIVASMRATRTASLEEMVASGLKRLRRMLSAGTTTAEIKTGYGLDSSSELRMLEAIFTLQEIQPIQVVPTFMPGHAFPPEVDRSQYVKDIIDKMMPEAFSLAKEAADGREPFMFTDVFCDEGYFTLEQTRDLLQAGANLGMKLKVHSDEFASLGATALATELKASSADHLLKITEEDIQRLSRSDTVGVLLPGTSFFLNLTEHAPARQMIDSGVAIALGSDFNPGSCHIFSLPLIWGLACLHLKMTVEECLTALTINAAHAIGLGDRVGQLTVGRQADFVIYDVSSLEEIPYNLGWNPVEFVFKKGALAFQRPS